jgi:NitT/TauT family transport system permease protein
VFYNALEGSRNIPSEMIQNASIFGAGRWSIMWRVRFPNAAAWSFASLPNAISFGLIGAITAEVLSGATGVGKLLLTSIDTTNADLTFAVVIYVGVLGVVLVLAATLARNRLLGWWDHDVS